MLYSKFVGNLKCTPVIFKVFCCDSLVCIIKLAIYPLYQYKTLTNLGKR